MKKSFEVKAEGWLGGVYRYPGDLVEMTEAEAQYLVMSGQIAAPMTAPAAEIVSAPSDSDVMESPRKEPRRKPRADDFDPPSTIG